MQRNADEEIDSPEATRRFFCGAMAGALSAIIPSRAARAQPPIAPPAIIRTGMLVMSINPTSPPLQFVNSQGHLQGLRVELGNEVARRLGLMPEYVRIEFAAMIPGLAGRRWDMINTGIFWTEDRARLMYMIPFERAGIAFLAARGNPLNIARVQDLAGRRVAVELGGIEERRTREISQELVTEGLRPIDIRTFSNSGEIFQVLRVGQVDAATGIDATAMFMQQRGDFSRVISGLLPQVATFAVARRDLAEAVVGALNEARRDGFYDALFERYGVLTIEETTFSIRGSGQG